MPKKSVTAEQLIAELAKVAPAEADDWRDLRAEFLSELSHDDLGRVYRLPEMRVGSKN